MRILLLNHFPLEGSGSGVYTAHTAKSLARKGHDVCVIMPENISDYKRYEGVELHPVFFKAGAPAGASESGCASACADEVKSAGDRLGASIDTPLPFNYPCFTTHPRSVVNFFELSDEEIEMYMAAFTAAVEEEIARFKPDIIHVQHIWLLAAIAVQFDLPVIITAHGTDLIGHGKSERFHRYTNLAAEKCRKIISISEDSDKLVHEYFPQADGKVQLMRNGYDEQVFYKGEYEREKVLAELGVGGPAAGSDGAAGRGASETEKAAGRSGERGAPRFDKLVCFAGKMTQIKGIDTLLRAAAIYGDERTATVLAGNGELFAEMNALRDELGLQDRVFFVGNLAHEPLRALYNVADVSVVPSRYEAFGLVAVEAMACGKYVVASRVGGLPDIIGVHEGLGKIFEVDAVEELAAAVDEVLDGTVKYDGDAIARFAFENYAQSMVIERLIEVYGEIV